MRHLLFDELRACLAVAALMVGLGCSSAAFADAPEGRAFVSAAVSYVDDDPDRQVDDDIAGGQFGLGFAATERWDIEAFIQAAALDGPASQDQVGIGLDVRHVFNRAGRFSPYLFVGAGVLDIDPDNGPRSDSPMYSAGIGFFWDIFEDSEAGLRTEYRFRNADTAGSSLTDDIVSIGLLIPFGRSEPPVVDSDSDGVPDGSDRCPGTRPGTPVDEFGCELDSDGDGVADSLDQCANTPAGARVDSRGCERDDDGDGVANSADRCPNTPRGAPVDADGCELDSDGDGVKDSVDQCPNTAANVRVDTRGCELRGEINLPSVQFETNSDRLRAGAETSLDDAARTLLRYPELMIEVEGHTDSDGAAEYNEGLSTRRALTVRDYLIEAGVAGDRLTARGYGEARPIADNGTADGKRQNRRVVLRLLNE